jgi:hypothetical protein
MKKRVIIVSLALFLLALVTAFIILALGSKPKAAPGIRAGSRAESFIVGMKDSAALALKDLIGQYTIVLAFTGPDNQSEKYAEKMKLAVAEKLLSRKNLLWLNIKKTNFSYIIEEQSRNLGLKYKSLWSTLPKIYDFKDFPSIIIIDKSGTIKFVYIGYSPTMIDDLAAGLKEK